MTPQLLMHKMSQARNSCIRRGLGQIRYVFLRVIIMFKTNNHCLSKVIIFLQNLLGNVCANERMTIYLQIIFKCNIFKINTTQSSPNSMNSFLFFKIIFNKLFQHLFSRRFFVHSIPSSYFTIFHKLQTFVKL